MSKITNDGLTRSSTGCPKLYPYGNIGRQRVNRFIYHKWMCNLLVLPPLLINVEICEMIALWNLELLSGCVRIVFATFWPIEDCRYRQHWHYNLHSSKPNVTTRQHSPHLMPSRYTSSYVNMCYYSLHSHRLQLVNTCKILLCLCLHDGCLYKTFDLMTNLQDKLPLVRGLTSGRIIA